MVNIWIVGAGSIAQEYAKIIDTLGYEFLIIGRGKEKVAEIKGKTHYNVVSGGVDSYIANNPKIPEYAIVATNISSLSSSCISLMKYGVKNILCEKPGFLYPEECEIVAKVAKENNCKVFIAYNRRFFASVNKAMEIIRKDGGVKSFNFEFTEWGHVIEKLNKPKEDLDNWLYANSSHVIDLAFFLGGTPVDINCITSGEISWHKPAIFAGSGISNKGAIFSYSSNWGAPGRWGVEVLTSTHRLYLRPMEKLQIQQLGSVAVSPVDIDYSLDEKFKPGFFLETKAFLGGNYDHLCSIEEQKNHVIKIYNRIVGKQ